MAESRSATLARLDAEAYSSLTTFKKDGTPVPVPIWHAVAGGHIYMFTEARSFKVRRLQRNPRIEIAPCNWRGAVSGPSWPGTGRVIEDAAVVARAYEALDRKYGWQKWLVDVLSRIGGRYGGRAILEIELDGQEPQ